MLFLQDPYTLKAFEYLLGLSFLTLFAGFWHYVAGKAHSRTQRPTAAGR